MNQSSNDPLDRLTKAVARAGGMSEEDAERVASSPFLHTRLRAEIESERRRRASQGGGWFTTVLVASRAIAVLVVVTVAAVATFWLSKDNAPVTAPPMSASSDDIARIVTGGTCALSTTEECAISTDEVLATLFSENGAEEPK